MAKKDYDKTLTRLISILTKLSNKERPNTKELACEFGVTDRTIQKDIYERLISFPIEKGSCGGFKFIDGYTLNKSTLSSDEMILISLALSQFKEVKDFDQINSKVLKKLVYPHIINPYYIKQDDIEDLDIDSKFITGLEEVITSQSIIKLHLNNKKEKIVEPYKIANFDSFWYLFAKDLEDLRVKTFELSSILKYTQTDNKYKKSQKEIEQVLAQVHSAFFNDGNTYEVEVLVYPEAAKYFLAKEFLDSQAILEKYDDGSVKISFEVTHDEDVDNIIKSWLPHIEVLKPKRFKDKLTKELKEYLNKLEAN